MKLFLLLLAVSLQVSASVHSQQITLSVKNAPLVEVMQSIRKQSGLAFMAAAEAIDRAKPVTVVLKDATIEESLRAIFKDQPFDYKVENKFIILTAKVAVSSGLVLPQPETDVHGVVVDSGGRPLANVTVLIKGEKNKITSTNERGEFHIFGAPEKGIILVRSIGYGTQEQYFASNNSNIIIRLQEVKSELGTVQIIAYGTQLKKFSTSNIGTVNADQIRKQPVSNPLLTLQGRVPGLFIQQTSGVTASPVNVNIQGINSLQSGSDPFYVIDGVPYTPQFTNYSLMGTAISGFGGSTFNFINPADIESISILKDADATAIYGSRAANGAILITTKKGKAGKTRVDINFQNGWGKIDHQVKLLNTQQYLEMRKEAYVNGGKALPNSSTNPTSSNYDLTVWDSNRYTDWQKTLVGGTAKFTDLQASVSGGSSTTQFLVGYGYNRQTTVYPNSLSDIKGNIHFNLNHNSNDNRFKYSLSATYLEDKNQLNSSDLMNLATRLAPNAPSLYNKDGSLNFGAFTFGSNTVRYSFSNPLVTTLQRYKGNTDNLTANNTVSYEIVSGLQLKTSMGFNRLNADETTINPITIFKPDVATKTRSAKYLTKSITSWIIEPQLTYIKQTNFGLFDALIGGTLQQNRNNVLAQTGLGYSNDAQLENLAAASSVTVNTVYNTLYKYNALFGRLNYRLNDKYILNFTARRDGTSRFGDKRKLHNFYAVGGAWLFGDEDFFKDKISWISTGKLRINYGTTGNDQIADYSYLSLLNTYYVDIPYQESISLYPTNIANPLLQWEETHKLNFGLDFGFLNERIVLSMNYFRNRSSNQLISNILPSTTGFPGITQNFPATIQNTGIEGQLEVSIINSKHFSWRSSVNMTIPRNKLIAFPDLVTSAYSNQLTIGQPINIIRVYRYAGVNSTTGLYEFLNNKGEKTSNPDALTDRIILDPNPKYYGGFLNSFQYKGIELDFLCQFVSQKANNYRFGNLPGSTIFNQPTTVLNRWKTEGDIADVQKASTSIDVIDTYNIATQSNAAYSGASYIRLKNASISYTLPAHLTNRAHIENLRIYLQGQNLLTITKFVGSDPETKALGSLPPLRMLTVGLQVGL